MLENVKRSTITMELCKEHTESTRVPIDLDKFNFYFRSILNSGVSPCEEFCKDYKKLLYLLENLDLPVSDMDNFEEVEYTVRKIKTHLSKFKNYKEDFEYLVENYLYNNLTLNYNN